jgi:hypothetical protein
VYRLQCVTADSHRVYEERVPAVHPLQRYTSTSGGAAAVSVPTKELLQFVGVSRPYFALYSVSHEAEDPARDIHRHGRGITRSTFVLETITRRERGGALSELARNLGVTGFCTG